MLKRTLISAAIAATLGGLGASSASAMPASRCADPAYQAATTGPKVVIDDVGQVAEAAGRARFKVWLTSAPTSPVTVNLCTADGNGGANWAAVGGQDYTDVDINVTFQPARWGYKYVCSPYPRYSCTQQWAQLPAETVKYVDVAITNDANCDNTVATEAFELRARSATNATIKDGRGQALIADDDSCGLF